MLERVGEATSKIVRQTEYFVHLIGGVGVTASGQAAQTVDMRNAEANEHLAFGEVS
jgi:hypothetical protein